jgi:hypothetical protein
MGSTRRSLASLRTPSMHSPVVLVLLVVSDELLEPDAHDFAERPAALARERLSLLSQLRWDSD